MLIESFYLDPATDLIARIYASIFVKDDSADGGLVVEAEPDASAADGGGAAASRAAETASEAVFANGVWRRI